MVLTQKVDDCTYGMLFAGFNVLLWKGGEYNLLVSPG